jgi:hypothetical protein
MRFREIMRFRRTSAGNVPLEVLQALELPMPADVLEQFVFDHGTKGEFQQQFGHLDLHGLRWDCLSIRAEEILACSVYPRFAEWIETAAGRTRVVPKEGWKDVLLPPGAAKHWQDHYTWMRAPVMLRGDLVGSDRLLHLVEGHTRAGALRGLIESGVLPSSSDHLVWVGEECTPPDNDGLWREVLRQERMPFLAWLMDRIGDDGDLGVIASRLIEAKYSSMSRRRISGDDLASALAYADAYPDLTPFKEVIRQAHPEWERWISE